MATRARATRLFTSEGWRKIRKPVILVVGMLVLLVGVALLFLPGPAIVVIPAGFAILATEFKWAKEWTRKSKQWLKRTMSKGKAMSQAKAKRG